MRYVSFLAVLAFAINASADQKITKKVNMYNDQASGEVTPPGPEMTTMSPANNCSAPHAAGVLPAAGGVLPGDTYYAGNDFEDVFGNCSYSYSEDPGGSGHDEIWEFMVETGGRWSFDTCTIPAGWDTTLALYEDIGIGCPGVPMVCDGDGCNVGGYESGLYDVCLNTGQTYWLVVDGWTPAAYFPGTYYDVTFARTVDPCNVNADCDDGDLCNGAEQCIDNCCVEGPPLCQPWEDCDPILQECFNPWPDCTSWVTDQTTPGSFSPQCFNGCTNSYFADDIELHPGQGHELISYQIYTQARNVVGAYPNCDQDEPLDTSYAVYTDIISVWDAGAEQCLPDEENLVAGASCVFDPAGLVLPGGSPADINICEPNGGLPTGVMLPEGGPATCGVDFYLGIISGNDGAGVSLSTNNQEQFMGGPALDDELGQSVVAFQDCTDDTVEGTWGLGAFSAPTVSDARGVIFCTNPSGPCCYDGGGCDSLTPDACAAAGGTTLALSNPSDPQDCSMYDGDLDGFYGSCDNCPDDWNPGQEDCDGDGEGNACEADPADQDSDGDGVCNGVDGCPNDPAKSAPGACGCGYPDIDLDNDNCFEGATCVPFDECPDVVNPPGECGVGPCDCDFSPAQTGDDDGDGVENCNDVCDGVDDGVFAPGCIDAIPTVSEWGLVVLALLLLVAGKVYFGRRTATA